MRLRTVASLLYETSRFSYVLPEACHGAYFDCDGCIYNVLRAGSLHIVEGALVRLVLNALVEINDEIKEDKAKEIR